MPDLSQLKNGAKFGVGFTAAAIVTAWLLFGIGEVLPLLPQLWEKQTFTPEVEIQALNHWIRDDQLTFAGKLINKSAHDWKSLNVAFIATDADGRVIGRCSQTFYDPRFWGTTITFEAICKNIPPGLTSYQYEVSLYGRY